MGIGAKTNVLRTKSKPKSTHVPGQYLGYSLQTTRCLAHLLSVKDLSYCVSIEVFEDVGVDDGEGNRIAEQNKSALDGNPVSDRAKDFWKTLSNWIDAVQSGELNPEKTDFIIHVAQFKEANLAQKFSDAVTIESAESALNEAVKGLWGEAPDYKLKEKIAEGLKEYVSKVFETDRVLVCKIITRLKLTFGNGNIHDALKESLQIRVPAELIEDVYLRALAWVKTFTDNLIAKSLPAIVPAREFYNEHFAYIRRADKRSILHSFAKHPDKIEIDTELKRIRTFVRQLDLIEFNEDQIIKAVANFLRACADRTEWSKRGLVHSSSFDELEERLTNKWENEKAIIEIIHSEKEEKKKGALLCVECCKYETQLEGLSCPPHFIPGSFHLLADSPDQEPAIGWHPEYKTRLRDI